MQQPATDPVLAVRITGEALALADTRWQQACNNRLPRPQVLDALTAMVQAAVDHTDALCRVQAWHEAYPTAVIVLYAAATQDALQHTRTPLTGLVFLATVALEQLLAQLTDAGEHGLALTALWASMLYDLTTHPQASPTWRRPAAEILRELVTAGAVTDTVKVNNRDVHPLSNDAVGDIIAHSRALRLLGPAQL